MKVFAVDIVIGIFLMVIGFSVGGSIAFTILSLFNIAVTPNDVGGATILFLIMLSGVLHFMSKM